MKKIIIMLAAGILMCTAGADAQTNLKLGYVNSQVLLTTMPEVVKADADLKAYAKQYQEQLETMAKDFDTKLQAYQTGEKTMSEAIKEVKQKELQDLQKRVEEFQQTSQEKIQKKKEDLYKPILEKADQAIKDVAKEKSYDYVFDASAGSLLFARESDDILPLVKAKLGIK